MRRRSPSGAALPAGRRTGLGPAGNAAVLAALAEYPYTERVHIADGLSFVPRHRVAPYRSDGVLEVLP